MPTEKGAKGKNRKYGRSKEKCAAYAKMMRRYKNKVKAAKKRYGRLPKEKLERILAQIAMR